MSITSQRTFIGFGAIALSLLTLSADAQIVRRYARGGVAVRAPFVRVDVGPGGATSVRAPFVAVDDPGGVYIGRHRRRRLYAQQQPPVAGYGAPYREPTLAAQPAYVDNSPLPTTEQLAAMNDLELINTVWDLSARLDARLARFDTGDGWRRYLGFPADAFSEPGVQPVEIRLDALVKTLARFDSVSDNPEYGKIAGLPIFIAAKAALRQAVTRFQSGSHHEGNLREGGPQMVDPSDPSPAPSNSESDNPNEVLPTPEPATHSAATRGERSILKQSTRR